MSERSLKNGYAAVLFCSSMAIAVPAHAQFDCRKVVNSTSEIASSTFLQSKAAEAERRLSHMRDELRQSLREFAHLSIPASVRMQINDLEIAFRRRENSRSSEQADDQFYESVKLRIPELINEILNLSKNAGFTNELGRRILADESFRYSDIVYYTDRSIPLVEAIQLFIINVLMVSRSERANIKQQHYAYQQARDATFAVESLAADPEYRSLSRQQLLVRQSEIQQAIAGIERELYRPEQLNEPARLSLVNLYQEMRASSVSSDGAEAFLDSKFASLSQAERYGLKGRLILAMNTVDLEAPIEHALMRPMQFITDGTMFESALRDPEKVQEIRHQLGALRRRLKQLAALDL